VIVDESEFVSETLWTNTIFPLNMEFRNSIIAATSPQSEDSFNHHLITLKDKNTGKNLFPVVYLFEVCDACTKAGKQAKCTHMGDQLSDSKRQDAVDAVRQAYRASQSAAKLRETFGVTTSSIERVVPAQYVERFFSNTIDIDDHPRCIYMAIDPSGGGDSEMGVVAICESFTMQSFMKLAVGFKRLLDSNRTASGLSLFCRPVPRTPLRALLSSSQRPGAGLAFESTAGSPAASSRPARPAR
jgi:hypothetical protein